MTPLLDRMRKCASIGVADAPEPGFEELGCKEGSMARQAERRAALCRLDPAEYAAIL
jgi:hypothetical protein